MTAGHLAVEIAAGAPARLVATRRPVARLFEGRSPDEVAGLMPLVFSVCGEAQAIACDMACEAAAGIGADEGVRTDRRRRILAEALREHLLRVLASWPAALAEAPDPIVLRAVARHVGAVRDGSADAAEALAAFTTEAIFGGRAGCLDGKSAFTAWADEGKSGAARLIRQVIVSGWADSGAAETRFLPAVDGDEIASLLAASADPEPVWNGAPHETTPLARMDRSPLIAALAARHGSGLLVRLAARLVEIAAMTAEIAALAGAPRERGSGPPARARADGIGVAQVETARGRLIHLVDVAGGRVRRYRIVAPTDWNFHSAGPARQGLTALAGDGRGALARRARLLIEAFDPCVAYLLKV